MQIVIVNRNRDTAEVFEWRFRDMERVTCICGSFEEIDHYDCMATAGNSFGLMDAGIDLAILKHFGPGVMKAIQARILKDYLGEQPVGTSFLVETGISLHPWVAHTPTMRAPMNINGTDNVYLATWATLLAVHEHNSSEDRKPIDVLVMPAFGTSTGGVPPLEASLQMRLACEHFFDPPEYLNPSFAQQRHETVYYGGRWGFENPRKEEF